MSDLISRQAAINSPVKMIAQGLDWVPVYHLEQLPSAERRGRWVKVAEGWGSLWKCDQCGEMTVETVMGKPRANYCPNCGARMDGE